MTSPADILGGMVDVADEQVENIETSIGQVEEQIDSYTEQVEGVTDGMCTPAKDDLTDYLDNTKLAELETTWGGTYALPFSVDYGVNYGAINYATGGLTDFRVLDATAVVVYEYLGTNWDSDTTITKLVGDFSFGNDYITRPLDTGATYGLTPNQVSMTSAKSLLILNKDKVAASKTVFGDYT